MALDLKKLCKQYKFIEDFDEFINENEGIFDNKNFRDTKVRALYINITENDEEIERYSNNLPCEFPSKIGLFTWDMIKDPGIKGLYQAYNRERGRNTGYSNDMFTVFLYPFNWYITKKIDSLIIRLLESIHKDLNQDIICSWNVKQKCDPRHQNAGTEFIKSGLVQKYVNSTMTLISLIEENMIDETVFDTLFYQQNGCSEKTKNLLRKITYILNDFDNNESEQSVDSYIEKIDFCVTNSSLSDSIDNSIIFKLVPPDWDINHNSLILSFDQNTTKCAINKITKAGYVSNANIVELSKISKENEIIRNIQIQYKTEYTSDEMENEYKNMDCIILNPPYDKNLYKKFFKAAYHLLSKKGKMMFICPAAFLTDQRYRSTGLDNLELRQKIECYVTKIIIENYNPEFNTRNNHPFSIIYIDKNKKGNKIQFICNGEEKEVYSINDCNLNGNSQMQLNIQKKCMSYKLLAQHRLVTKSNSEEIFKGLDNKYFVAFNEMLSTPVSNPSFNKQDYNIKGLFYSYTECYVHHNYQYVLTQEEAKQLRDDGKLNWFFYGTKEEMENWIYNSMNLKLMKAFSIIRFWDQHNQVMRCAPFLCEQKYTDSEIYELLNINEKEQKYIDELLAKYNMNGQWFQKYITGKYRFESNRLI